MTNTASRIITLARLLSFLRPFLGWVTLSMLLRALTVASGIGLLGTSAYLIAMAALRPSVAVLQVAIVGVRFFWNQPRRIPLYRKVGISFG